MLDWERELIVYTQNINTGSEFREFANLTPVVVHVRKLRPREAKRLFRGYSNFGQSQNSAPSLLKRSLGSLHHTRVGGIFSSMAL